MITLYNGQEKKKKKEKNSLLSWLTAATMDGTSVSLMAETACKENSLYWNDLILRMIGMLQKRLSSSSSSSSLSLAFLNPLNATFVKSACPGPCQYRSSIPHGVPRGPSSPSFFFSEKL